MENWIELNFKNGIILEGIQKKKDAER